MEKNIKDYREKELKTFVLGNILLFLVITGVINDIASLIGEDNLWKAIAELFESSILSSIVYIFVFVFDSIVQGKLKDRIIWPIKGLPGNRIFLDIAQKDKDERITKEMAQNVYKDIYEEIKATKDKKKVAKMQNGSWYRIYQKYENQAQVYISQRDYLLFRDMTIMTLWIGVIHFLLSWFLKRSVPIELIKMLVAEFLLLWIAARVKGERFTYNVIAKDVAKYYEENKTGAVILK